MFSGRGFATVLVSKAFEIITAAGILCAVAVVSLYIKDKGVSLGEKEANVAMRIGDACKDKAVQVINEMR